MKTPFIQLSDYQQKLADAAHELIGNVGEKDCKNFVEFCYPEFIKAEGLTPEAKDDVTFTMFQLMKFFDKIGRASEAEWEQRRKDFNNN